MIKSKFRYIIYRIITFFVDVIPFKKKLSKKILIVKTDGVGDYILFRNYLKSIREHYKEYHISFCANIVNQDLIQNFDIEYIDELLLLDHNRFLNNLSYRFKFLMNISKKNYDIAFQPRYSRQLWDTGDFIIYASKATSRMGFSVSRGDRAGAEKSHMKIYTDLLFGSEEKEFEFYQNKGFFEKLLRNDLGIQKPELTLRDSDLPLEISGKYIILFPGAGAEFRQWSTANFARLAEFLVRDFDYKIIIAGSKSETHLGKDISKRCNNESIVDLTGKFSLSQLAGLLSQASLLISNETAAAHIAVAVNTPVVCISNGNHYGRFTPYPPEIYKSYYPVYPPGIMDNIKNHDKLLAEYTEGSELDINTISVATVYKVVRSALDKLID